MLKACEAATVTAVASPTSIELRRDVDGKDLGFGFAAADLVPAGRKVQQWAGSNPWGSRCSTRKGSVAYCIIYSYL